MSYIYSFKNGQALRWMEFRSRIKRLSDAGVTAIAPGKLTARENDILLTIKNEEDAVQQVMLEAEKLEHDRGR